jgi:hypothetical protein
VTVLSVSDATTMGVPQHGQLACRVISSSLHNPSARPFGLYFVATASISTRMSSLANPVTSVALAGLCFPKNLA